MKKSVNRPLATTAFEDLLDAFASNEPVPGGGSASALAGAVGVALLIKVAGLPKTKTDAPEETADLAEAAARLRPLRETLSALIDQDTDAYAAVLAARRLPKESETEARARRAAIDTAMTAATEVPLETMRACQQALRGAVIVAASGNRNAASDTGIAIELLLAGLRGGGMNVDINTRGLSDGALIDRVARERVQLEADGDADARRARERLAPEIS